MDNTDLIAKIVLFGITAISAWLLFFRSLDFFGGFGGRNISFKLGFGSMSVALLLFGISLAFWGDIF